MRGVQALKVTFIRGGLVMAFTKHLPERTEAMLKAALFGTALSVMTLSAAWALPALGINLPDISTSNVLDTEYRDGGRYGDGRRDGEWQRDGDGRRHGGWRRDGDRRHGDWRGHRHWRGHGHWRGPVTGDATVIGVAIIMAAATGVTAITTDPIIGGPASTLGRCGTAID